MSHSAQEYYIEDLRLGARLKRFNDYVTLLLSADLDAPRHVVDWGAGIGTISEQLRKRLQCEFSCVEIEEEPKAVLTGMGFPVYDDVASIDGPVDVIVSSHALEHVSNDVEMLERFYDRLEQGGRLKLVLPASMKLWSEFDERIGHYRRYSRRDICEKCVSAGFQVERVHYFDFVGFCLGLVAVRVRHDPSTLASVQSLDFFDRLVPFTRIADRVTGRWFGRNIYVSCVKT